MPGQRHIQRNDPITGNEDLLDSGRNRRPNTMKSQHDAYPEPEEQQDRMQDTRAQMERMRDTRMKDTGEFERAAGEFYADQDAQKAHDAEQMDEYYQSQQ